VKNIALIIDNVRLSETLRLNLEEEGYGVIQLGGLKKDLRLIRDEPIDMLILDVDVPVYGVEFIKEAKKINPLLPVVLLSSFEENLVKFIFREIEFVKTFVKPFDLEEFSGSIKTILGHPDMIPVSDRAGK